jgi:hypothetical protein
MAPISLLISVLTVLAPLISVLPNVTVIPIEEGTCSGFPSSYDTAGRNADAFVFRPSSVDNAAINNLPTYIASNTLIVSLTNITDPSIFCCTVLDGLGYSTLLIPANSNMMQLQYLDTKSGIKPETYAHAINGARQDSTFLGSRNVTTWTFGRLAKETNWRVRLLGVGSEELQDGEVRGFLKVLVT